MNKETMIAIPADPDDPEDFDVSVASVERAHLMRDVRLLRTRLGLDAAAFAERYGLPVDEYPLWEWARRQPSQGEMAYLKVILAEPEVVARALAA